MRIDQGMKFTGQSFVGAWSYQHLQRVLRPVIPVLKKTFCFTPAAFYYWWTYTWKLKSRETVEIYMFKIGKSSSLKAFKPLHCLVKRGFANCQGQFFGLPVYSLDLQLPTTSWPSRWPMAYFTNDSSRLSAKKSNQAHPGLLINCASCLM